MKMKVCMIGLVCPKIKFRSFEFIENSLTENGKWYTKETFANTKPGEIREYSNIGAALCAQIIEFATGQDYQSFTKECIISPLKMTSSGWSSKILTLPNVRDCLQIKKCS